MRTAIMAIIVLGLLLGACNQSDEPELTTTTTLIGSSTTLGAPSSSATPTSTTTTKVEGQAVETYEIIARSATDTGEVLYVVIPAGDYSDIDLEQFVSSMVDQTQGLAALHVFDDRAAAEALLAPVTQRSADQESLIEVHYLISLNEGNLVRFEGPFSQLGEFVLGS